MRRSSRPRRNPSSLDNPAFRRWFGDSKVVDENGEPMAVYHGGAKVTVFKPSEYGGIGAGIYTTPSRGSASQYAHGPGSKVTSFFARVEHPLVVFVGSGSAEQALVDALGPDVIDAVRHDAKHEHRGHAVQYGGGVERLVREAGYDGIFVMRGHARDLLDDPYSRGWIGKIDEIVVFEPTQLKSSKSNSGAYDPSDPDITRNRRSSKRTSKRTSRRRR
jgi:hypothetical protein